MYWPLSGTLTFDNVKVTLKDKEQISGNLVKFNLTVEHNELG